MGRRRQVFTDEERRRRNREAVRRWQKSPKGHAATKVAARKGFNRIAAYKAEPCTDCGGRFPPECMDFDHVRGEKTKEISKMITYSLEALLAEMAKCDLVCANCHRIRTRKRRNMTIE